MELREHLDDCMIERLRYVYDDLLEDVKYTFEEETNPYELPRDLESALNEIDLEWVINNHIDCCGYANALEDSIEDYATNHADCDAIICDYGIIRAIETHYEYGDSLEDLTYKILIEDYDYTEGDIYEAIYEEALEYIYDELAVWFIEFSTVDARDAMSLGIICDKNGIDYVFDEDESCQYVDIHTYDAKGNSHSVRAIFKSGYTNALETNGLTTFFDHICYDEDDNVLRFYNSSEACLGRIRVNAE